MCPRRKFGIPETDLQESNTEVLPFKANAYYPAFYRNNQKVGTSGYLRIMWLRKIWEEGTFAILKGEHKRNKIQKRGLQKATEECHLSATALNLKRLVKAV